MWTEDFVWFGKVGHDAMQHLETSEPARRMRRARLPLSAGIVDHLRQALETTRISYRIIDALEDVSVSGKHFPTRS